MHVQRLDAIGQPRQGKPLWRVGGRADAPPLATLSAALRPGTLLSFHQSETPLDVAQTGLPETGE